MTFFPMRLSFLSALLFFVSACGGGGSGGNPSPTATPTPTTTVRPTPTPTASPTDLSVVRSVFINDIEHRYRLYVPGGLVGNTNVPLVIALHGGGMTAEYFDQFTRLRTTAAARGFALMTPTGGLQSWNAGSCCAPSSAFGVNHVRIISAMLDDAGTLFSIDEDRVFAAGHSNGGMMAYRLACELSDRIAAIASNAAVMMDRNLDTTPPTEVFACQPVRPVPVLHIHGLGDLCAPFEGGMSTGAAGGMRAPASESIDFWVANNRCSLDPLVASYRNGNARCERYNLCQAGANVELCTIERAGHIWPGNGISPAVGDVCGGTGSNDLNANDYIWTFFSRHPRR